VLRPIGLIQEAQLSQRDCARFVSLNILLSHSRSLNAVWNDTVDYGVFKSLLVFHWNYVPRTVSAGRSRPLKMAPYDRSYTTFYWPAIVSTYSCMLYQFRVIWHWVIVTLKSRSDVTEGHWRSFKPVAFESFGAVSYSPSIVTMALSCINSEIKRDIGQKSSYFHTPCIRRPR